MNIRTLFALGGFCLISLTTFAQTQQTQAQLSAELSKMEKKWAELKKQNGDSYTYVNTCHQGEGGFNVNVRVTVKEGKLVKAEEQVVRYHPKVQHEKPKTLKLKSADGRFGTVEDMLNYGKNTVLTAKAADFNRLILSDEKGLPQHISMIQSMLMDACADGFTITSFEFEKKIPNLPAKSKKK